jgi:hypothetical protein
MTILSAIQSVCKVVGLDVPTAVLASTAREHLELVALANEMADRIAQSHDWQAFKTLATITGDGATEDHSLPTDYARMLKKAQLWSSSLETPLSPISDTDEWLGLDVQTFDFVVNAWTIYGNQMHIKPALASAVTAKYFYITDLIVSPSSGSNKTDFTADNDMYRLSERLLALGMIWQWRAHKGLAYQQDMETFEALKETLIRDDKGSRMVRLGNPKLPDDVTTSYPQSITV